MEKKRPVGVTVFAVLSIVFGSMGLLCGLCNVASLAGGATMMQNMQPKQAGGPKTFDQVAMMKYMEEHVPGYVVVTWGQAILGLLMSALLLSTGIGLLRMNPAARWGSIAYGVVTVLLQIGSIVYTVTLLNPAMDEYLKISGVDIPGMSFGMAGGAIAGGCLGMTYALALLIFMLLPGTAKAFASGGVEVGPAGDYYDAGFERQRRESEPDDRFTRPDDNFKPGD